jgi:uncharacterized low-complexity protein
MVADMAYSGVMSAERTPMGAARERAGQGRAGQGRAGQGRAGQGRAGQGRAGQGSCLWVTGSCGRYAILEVPPCCVMASRLTACVYLSANVRVELTQQPLPQHSISCLLHRTVLTLRTFCRLAHTGASLQTVPPCDQHKAALGEHFECTGLPGSPHAASATELRNTASPLSRPRADGHTL